VTAFKLSLPGRALGQRRGPRPSKAPRTNAAAARVEPLPPILALEGDPDPSLRSVIDELAARLGASVCPIEGPAALAADPDLDSVVAVVLTRPRGPLDLQQTMRDARRLFGNRPFAILAPQPLSSSLAGVMPLDPACVAPPVTVERLLFALEADGATRA
jgi:hypothetical protein